MGGNRGRRRVPTWLVLTAGAVGAGAVAWAGGQRGWAAVLAAAGVTLALASYLADRKDTRAGDIDTATLADRLADQVREQWSAEARLRHITRPPMDVSWRPADPSLVQPWPYLRRLAAAGAGWTPPANPAAGPHELAGTGADLIEILDRVLTGRLVVLGEPGAGKTVLLIRLVLDLLARRAPGEAVPLLVPLASWDPGRHDLYTWLETQIVREHPWLGDTAATGVSRARALLDAGLVLPVLDGLDEIRSGGRDQTLTAVNDTLRDGAGLILSCRAKAFRHAVRPGPHRQPVFVEGAAGIRLDPLDPGDVAAYLTETAGAGGPARWAPVRAALAATPAPPVAWALSTPLMASLARTVYNPPAGGSALGLPNPADLCNTTELPTRTAVEEHLFDGLIPAAYRPHPAAPNRWRAEQAEPYLVFLTRHLEHRLHTTSLAWWELADALPRALRVPIRVKPFPSQITLRRPRLSDFMPGLVAGLALGLLTGLIFGFAFGLMVGLAAGLTLGLAFGLAVGLVRGLGLDTTADTRRSADPQTVLAQDRASALVVRLVVVLVVVLVVGLVVGLVAGLVAGLALGLIVGLIVGTTFVLDSAWGRLCFARLWLVLNGYQPLHLMAFLDDAHQRGVLRQAGAVWEFRHANLQRRLANRRDYTA